jgi:hypothetical protein
VGTQSFRETGHLSFRRAVGLDKFHITDLAGE